jgi:hypothetical protein
LPPATPPKPTLWVEVPGVPWDSPAPSLNHTHDILAAVDVSTDSPVEIDCERCGRRLGYYDVTDDPLDGFAIHEVEREPLAVLGYVAAARVDRGRGLHGRPTGRHRMRVIDGRDGVAYKFQCGCGHERVIGPDALKRKLIYAADARMIWL